MLLLLLPGGEGRRQRPTAGVSDQSQHQQGSSNGSGLRPAGPAGDAPATTSGDAAGTAVQVLSGCHLMRAERGQSGREGGREGEPPYPQRSACRWTQPPRAQDIIGVRIGQRPVAARARAEGGDGVGQRVALWVGGCTRMSLLPQERGGKVGGGGVSPLVVAVSTSPITHHAQDPGRQLYTWLHPSADAHYTRARSSKWVLQPWWCADAMSGKRPTTTCLFEPTPPAPFPLHFPVPHASGALCLSNAGRDGTGRWTRAGGA